MGPATPVNGYSTLSESLEVPVEPLASEKSETSADEELPLRYKPLKLAQLTESSQVESSPLDSHSQPEGNTAMETIAIKKAGNAIKRELLNFIKRLSF